MTTSNDVLEESTIMIREIETNLDKALQKRREDIAREFEEKIRREKEEQERALLKVEEEFARRRGHQGIPENALRLRELRDQFQTRSVCTWTRASATRKTSSG